MHFLADSNGNRVVNGVNSPSGKPSPSLSLPNPVAAKPVAARPVAPKPAGSKPVPSAGTGAGAYKPDNSGAYKPDNSGAYKPSG